MLTTTLKEIRKHKPCVGGWKNLIKGLGGIKNYGEDTPITFQQICDINGYGDTLWCLRATDEENHYLWRHFAVDCAKQVEYLTTDERSKNALVVARAYADEEATEEELIAARAAAWATSDAAWDAARAAAWATSDAAWDAARDAARDAASDADSDATRAAARAAARAAQIKLLLKYCELGKRPENSVELLAEYIKEQTK